MTALADMSDKPISAGWYWHLNYQNSVIRELRRRHAEAIHLLPERSFRQIERDQIAQGLSAALLELNEHYMRTMSDAGVLCPVACGE